MKQGSWVDTKCPVCGSTPSFRIDSLSSFEIVRCVNCRLEYAHPMRSENAQFYQDKKFYQLKRILTEKRILPSLRAKWEFGEFLRAGVNPGGKLLDIGCGEGQFLHYAQKRGYQVYGIDIDELSADVGREHFGLESIFVGDLDRFCEERPRERFDCITFFELLEHLENPKDFLSKVRGLLSAGGYVALSTPNSRRLTARLGFREKYDFPPHHLTRWNRESLKYFLESAGFEVVRHEFTPQVLRYVVAGMETFWGADNRSADGFLDALASGRRYALWVMKSYLEFLDVLVFFESTIAPLLRMMRIEGISHFVLARKVEA